MGVRAAGIFFPANGRFYTMGGRSADVAGNDFTHPFEYNPTTTTQQSLNWLPRERRATASGRSGA